MTGLLAAALAALACRLALAPGPAAARRRLRRVAAGSPAPGRRSRTGRRGAGRRGGVSSGLLPGPVVLDLVAAVLSAGAPLGTALRVVGEAAAAHGDPWTALCLRHVARQHDLGLDLPLDLPLDLSLGPSSDRSLGASAGATAEQGPGRGSGPAGGGAPGWVRELADAVGLARDAGVAVAPLLVAAAAQERRRDVAAARVAAARLAVQVVLPTGLCLLPAFVLLAVVPLVLGLLGVGA